MTYRQINKGTDVWKVVDTSHASMTRRSIATVRVWVMYNVPGFIGN